MKKNFLLKFFPPPKYLRMSAAGIDISDRSIKYIEMNFSRIPVSVNRCGTIEFPEGIIENGEIKDRNKFIEFLKLLKKQIKTNYIIADLPEEKAYIAFVKLPAMEFGQIREALEMQLEEHIPISGKDAVFDYNVSDYIPGEPINLNLVAFPKALAESYGFCILEAGFSPAAFELEVQATARAVVSFEDIKRSIMFIDFGKTRTTLAISKNGKVRFSSTIKIGGRDLENAIVKNLQVGTEKAEIYKKECGLAKTKENEKIFNALMPIISAIKDEARKYIVFWNSQTDGDALFGISKIMVCGGDSNLTGFSEYLAAELKIPVETANPWVNIFSFNDHIPEIELKESLIYATAIGLALRQYCEFGKK